MLEEFIDDASNRMGKTIENLRSDLMSIRTGRANPSLVDKLEVDYYGSPTPLQQIASISVPEAQLLVIRPFTPTDIPDIEKAIIASDIGITPGNDGQQIRLAIPALTGERRKELTKQVSSRAEDARIAVRNIRRDVIADIRELEGEGEISEDDLHRGQDVVQKTTDEFIKKIGEVAKAKEEEIESI